MKYQAKKIFYSVLTGRVKIGTEIELDEKQAKPLVSGGYIVSVEPKPKKAIKKGK